MTFMFQPQSCRFMLYGPFNKIINDQLQILQFDPIHGVELSFQCCTKECSQSVTIVIDPKGNLSKLSVIDPETNSAEMIFDFSRNVFNHYGEPLDLICGHPIFHRLQQATAARYREGHYSVTVTAL